jgi:hypothetical protein
MSEGEGGNFGLWRPERGGGRTIQRCSKGGRGLFSISSVGGGGGGLGSFLEWPKFTGLASFIAACPISQAENICPWCEVASLHWVCKYFSQPVANVLIEGENKLNIASIYTYMYDLNHLQYSNYLSLPLLLYIYAIPCWPNIMDQN